MNRMKRRTSRRFQSTMTTGHDELESRQLLSTGFQLVTSVSGLTPAAVAAISPTDVVAVGSGTLANGNTGALIETFNGTTWSAATVPAERTGVLNGVAASSSSDVFAVGETLTNGVFTPLVEFFNGTSWTVQSTPALASNGSGDDTAGGGELDSVAVISPTDVWAVGGLGNGRGGQLIEHFNGTSWSVVASPVSGDGHLDSISAVNANDIFAVGNSGEEHPGASTLQFNGTTWSAVANGPSGTESVDAISATDVWAVGGAGVTGAAVWNFNGTSWTEVGTLDGQLTAVSGSLSNDVYVVGEGDLVEQWNGTRFNVVSATGTAGFTGVATLSNGTAFAVGGNGIEEATTSVATTAIPTTTALTSSASSAPFGGSVTLTATITPSSTGSAAPTGSVDFFDGSTMIGGGTVSGDVATLVTTALPVGTNSITATYEGDSNYAVSTSQAITIKTTQAATTTAVSFSPAEPVLGQDTTLTAAITPTTTGPVAPSGTVEFFDGSTLLGSGTVSGDVATLVTTALPVGTSTLTATYEGDGNYSASTAPGVSVTVVSAATPASPPFQLMTSPTIAGATLNAVTAVSPTDIWAVGFQGSGPTTLAENFNGTSWSVVATPNPAGTTFETLNAVSAASSNAVWAVGDSVTVNSNDVSVATPLVEFFNGTAWSIQTTPTLAGGGAFNSVAVISPTDVWAVGGSDGNQLIEHFNGTSWSVVASPDAGDGGTLVSISAANANDIFAVGSVGEGEHPSAAALQFNGTTWSAVANGPTGTHSVDAISATDVWVVGGAGGGTGAAVWNFNGTAWTEVATLDGQLTAVSGSSANDVYVVGEGDLVEQWNGTRFNVVSATGTAGFTGVATLSNGTAFAVGGNGIETNASTAPTPTPTPAATPTPTPAATPTSTATPAPTPAPNPDAVTSENWSGYVAATSLSVPESDSVTAVSGSWVVPTVSSSSGSTSDSAVWVGIDGFSNGTVEQIGTSQDEVNGTAVYQVWYEMYSTGKQQPEQIISGMTIRPGDSISAAVQYIASGTHAGEFELTITDNSRANDSFTTFQLSSATQSPTAARSSAEWIVEAPTVGNNIAALANVGSVTFTSASATLNGVSGPIDDSSWQSEAINIASSRGTLEDTTSVLTNSGTSFAVTVDSTSGSSNTGGSGSASRNAALKTTLLSNGAATRQSVAQPQQVVVLGVIPEPQHKSSAFRVPSGPLGS